jgi:hypothetical protein
MVVKDELGRIRKGEEYTELLGFFDFFPLSGI